MSNLAAAGALPPFDVNLLTDYQAHVLGANFVHLTNTGSGVFTMLAAATNVSGMILRFAGCVSNGTAGNFAKIFASDGAPTSYSDAGERCILFAQGNPAQLLQPLYLEAGIGLYFATNNATNVAVAGWDLL